jgi:tetratricopeptide (TPR) repeat protein
MGIAALMLGQTAQAEEWLERALALDPEYADVSRLLGELQYRGGRIGEAIATYEAALRHAPGDPAFEEPLARWEQDARLHARSYRSRGAHFSVLFQGPADDRLARRAVEMLEAAYWRIGAALATYPAQPITVVLYTQEQFRDVTRSPSWAAGAYDGTIRVPMRGALDRPEELDRVLAHEFVHAVVATLGGRNVPVWVDEGLASVFEPGATAEADEAVLARAASRPSLQALERGFARLSGPEAQAAYALSAVAVRRMVLLRGAPAVVTLLQDLGRGTSFEAAFYQRMAMRYDEFQALVARR